MQKIFQVALQIEESAVLVTPLLRLLVRMKRSCPPHADASSVRWSPLRLGFENAAGFKQTHVVSTSVEVVGQHVEHAGNQRAAHDRRFFALRIGQFNHRRRGKRLRVLVRNESERDGFVVAQGEQQGAELGVFVASGDSTTAPANAGRRVGEFIVAMEACDLFHQDRSRAPHRAASLEYVP